MRVWDIEEFELLAEISVAADAIGLQTYNTKIIVSGEGRMGVEVYDYIEKGVIKKLADVQIARGVEWGIVIDDE